MECRELWHNKERGAGNTTWPHHCPSGGQTGDSPGHYASSSESVGSPMAKARDSQHPVVEVTESGENVISEHG